VYHVHASAVIKHGSENYTNPQNQDDPGNPMDLPRIAPAFHDAGAPVCLTD
jgi:hypothetical protein